MRPIHAKLEVLPAGFKWFSQHEREGLKVDRLCVAVTRGMPLPPPVVVRVGDSVMPIDGHHRTAAHDHLKRPLEAWVVGNRAFENLCMRVRDEGLLHPEVFVLCDGVPALQVAPNFDAQHARIYADV